MKFLWLMSFLMTFALEVRVKASSLHSYRIAPQKPSISSCEDSWIVGETVLTGCHWIQGYDFLVLRTVYGTLQARNADFTIDIKKNRIYVVNHLGNLRVQLKDGRSVDVPQGFAFWFSELNQQKQSQMGMLQPTDLSEHLKLLGSLWKESSKTLQQRILLYKERWGNRTEIAARYYQGLVIRKIASTREIEENRKKKQLEQQKSRQAQKKVLFERVFSR